MHWETSAAADLEQALSTGHRFVDHVQILENFVVLHYGIDARRDANSAKFIIENDVAFQSSRGAICDLQAGGPSIEDAITSQSWIALGRNQHSGLSVAKNLIFFQDTWNRN